MAKTSRTFSARPSFGLRCLALLLWAAAGALLWYRWVITGAVALVSALLAVERIVGTRYEVDDNQLRVCRGRLSRPETVNLNDIAEVVVKGEHVVVKSKHGRTLWLHPANAESLYKLLCPDA